MHTKQEPNRHYLFLQPRRAVPQPLSFPDCISISLPSVVPDSSRLACS
jgi:hypothetical protein